MVCTPRSSNSKQKILLLDKYLQHNRVKLTDEKICTLFLPHVQASLHLQFSSPLTWINKKDRVRGRVVGSG